ncbi:lanthionine synthetase C family protein [Dinghuibacter silviterrae]|uniref:Lanthionine synthetase-like protein n=1 Tax=Dinghuibacter silviterrae TaxID=1539049 RepID=A0A4R8DQU8_9BACT|nr:lanthionine synthetase C family protein [Dinghuibacter silviterrae]TDX00534.1 lanthionine synthetase-like protein [Dinghuibacter silviterrae]
MPYHRLQNIYLDINKDKSVSPALLTGAAGIQLFNLLYLKNKNETADEACQENIQLLAEHSLSFTHPTFCSGFAGTNWFFKYLYGKGLLTSEDVSMLCYRDTELENTSIQMLETGNYDFLHGAVGIAYYLLYPPNTTSEGYFPDFFSIISSLIDKNTTEVNFGLSHGIPSILKFCVQCFKQGICMDASQKLAEQIILILLANTNPDPAINYFPYSISTAKETERRTRLAWCYGDLGVGIVLYQAGTVFQNKQLVDFSLEVLLHSTKRKNSKEARVSDACVCHGSAGIAHIYNRMWHYTRNPVFKEACDYWIQKTVEFSAHEDGIAGYKKYDGLNNVYINEGGLIEGTAGVGLALLSYLTGDFSWDYCLMLND